MGVSGLWPEISSAAITGTTFEKEAHRVFDEACEIIQEGSDLDEERLFGLRVGIDASAWFIHSEKSDGGANPALRNMFHRVIRLAKAGTRALFVFDGPHRPSVKRGKHIFRGRHGLQEDFIKIVDAFGFEWRTAPGEAEAELAHLSQRGLLDMVITDDVDCLLFGVTSMFKHALIGTPSKGIYPCIYSRSSIEEQLGLSVPGMILVALMSGGDYDQSGLQGVGPKIAVAFARAGFGENLEDIMLSNSDALLRNRLQDLRDTMRHELRTNESGYFDRKAGAVASKFHDAWPDVEVAFSYYRPVTTSSPKYKKFDKAHTWSQSIDVGSLVKIMDDLFEFTHVEILQKLRSQVWECIVIRDLVQKLRTLKSALPSTLTGTPTKQLAATLQNFKIQCPAKSRKAVPEPTSSLVDLVCIEKKRAKPQKAENFITEQVQLVIDPHRAAELASSLLCHPDPNIGKLEARKAEAAARIALLYGSDHPEATPAPPRNIQFEDPDSVMKLWMQESLLKMSAQGLIEEWQNREEAKLLAKANKGKKVIKPSTPQKPKKSAKATVEGSRTPVKAVRGETAVIKNIDEVHPSSSSVSKSDVFVDANSVKEDGIDSSSDIRSIRIEQTRAAPKAPAYRSRIREDSDSSSDSDVQIMPTGPATYLARKSPRKSPRKAVEQKTVREGSSHQAPSSAVGREPLYPKVANILPANRTKPLHIPDTPELVVEKDRAKPTYTRVFAYQRTIEADSSDDELPSLTDIIVPKSRMVNGSSGLTKTVSSSSHNAGSITKAINSRIKTVQSEIIDLCSSD